MKKHETVEEYLARGGKVQVVPAEKPEPQPNVIRSTSHQGLPRLYSLPEGEFFFGEFKKKNNTKTDIISRIEGSKLPKDIIESLKRSIKEK